MGIRARSGPRWPYRLRCEDTPRTSCESEPMGLASQNFLNEVLPVAPDVPVQIAHLTGAGAYDDPLVDQALAELPQLRE